MSNPTKETLEDEKGKSDDRIPNQRTEPSQEWETMARAWITAFPDAKADVSSSEVETWIGSNFDSLPADLRVMPRSEVVDRLLSMQHYMRPTPLSDHHEQNVEENHNNQSDQHPARFQRTDQWLPVYSWLESLDHGDLVKSKDISEWLDANPEVKDELSSRHSRYHLTHYVKKCHLKILKRKEKKGLIRLSRETAMEVHKEFGEKHTSTISCNASFLLSVLVRFYFNERILFLILDTNFFPADPLSNMPKDSDLYHTKQKEAKRRFEILVELEKKLAPHFSRPRIANR